MSNHGHDDYEVEAQPGLPEALPAGERLLWQGQPQWRQLAREAFHVRKVGLYFALLMIWQVASALQDGTGLLALAIALLKLSVVAAIALGLLLLLAWGSARETIYTVTDKRVVMRFGMALRLTLNLPFTRIQEAGVKPLSGNSGDIALQLVEGDRISYAVLWPHARPWQLSRPQPVLRCIDDAESVVSLLAAQLQELGEQQDSAAATEQADQQAKQQGSNPSAHAHPGMAGALA